MLRAGFNFTLVFASFLVAGLATAQQPLPAEGDEAELIAVLQSDAELFDKAKACQRLAVIGTEKSVPVLAGLLDDDKLSHYARFGLESNPASDVDEAFREALGELSGEPLVGVINSIGVRRDSRAVDALIAASDDDDQLVTAASRAALGAIATPQSVAALLEMLASDDSMHVATADACLTAADRLLVENRNAEAAKVFAALRATELPTQIDIAARFGQIRAGGDPLELMNDYLAADDRDLFRIGLDLAHDLTDPETTEALLEQLETLPAARKVLLIEVLGNRGDRSALPAVVSASGSDQVEIRVAATRVLGRLGDVSVVPVLLESAVSTDERLAQAARDSLAELDDRSVDAAIVDALPDSDGAKRIAIVDAVGRRGISDAIPSLLRFMESDDADLSNAAIDALAMTVGAKQLPALVDQLVEATSPSEVEPLRDALRKACQRMPDRDAAAEYLFKRMKSASAKAELLDLLIYVGGPKALEGIGAIAKSGDDELVDAATQALGKWLTPDVAPVLLDLAQNGDEKYRVRCLRGYIRVIRQFGLRTGERLQMSRKALDAATRDEERKLVLDTLTRFPTAGGLRMITPHLDNPALQNEAAKAAVSICEKLVTTDRKTVAATMPKVLAAINNEDLANRARVVIARAKAN